MVYQHLESAMVIEDLDHECASYLELRVRNKVGGTAYANQCQFCGEFRGGEISKSKVKFQPTYGDPCLEGAFNRKRMDLLSLARTELMPSLGPWQGKTMDQKLSELEAVIRGYCKENEVDVSNLLTTYLIRQRNNHIDEGFSSRWHGEEELHTWFEKNFSRWFYIYHEVSGVGFVNREVEHVRIDFVIKAKDELVAHCFTDKHIGVEVKYLSPVTGKGFHGKSSRGVFQALSYWYSGARWDLPNESGVELATVLVFSNLSFQDESDYVFGSYDSHYRKVWRSYLSVANHANVGELTVKIWNGAVDSWAMNYDGSKYYSMSSLRGLMKGDPNVIAKRRIGSVKK